MKEKPNKYLSKLIKESEKQLKLGDYYHFNNPKDAVRFLKKRK